MNGMMPYHEQLETAYRLRTQKPLNFNEESERIERIKAHAGAEESDKDRCSELILMAGVFFDMDQHFFGDVDKWMESVMDRLKVYAKQYIGQQNRLNGFSGDEPLPPDVIFEGTIEFRVDIPESLPRYFAGESNRFQQDGAVISGSDRIFGSGMTVRTGTSGFIDI